MQQTKAERLFSGSIGQEYDMLKVICPSAAKVSHKVGQALAEWAPGRSLDVFEIGCGTGITSLSLLTAREGMTLTAVDNEPDMLNQARHNLAEWVESGRLRLYWKRTLCPPCKIWPSEAWMWWRLDMPFTIFCKATVPRC